MRRTRHRRRFHTDRIVSNRRARYKREAHYWEGIRISRLAYGALADRDPWDCGRSCWMCHYEKREPGRRTRGNREWRREWGL